MGAQSRLNQQKRFGVSSEKFNPEQLALMLFYEIEMAIDVWVEETTIETVSYKRKKLSGKSK
ncbi:transposase domain-containing protein [Lysinibacillus sp. NPDC094403]|uniref:transposase domain-containing protein n=1 Tax=Lysinibacillus sp. NPDC094403 TaxID=3390581 RepID=UPI003D0872F1